MVCFKAALDDSFYGNIAITFEISLMEVDNALNQTVKEIQNRYDFKGVETKL